MGRTTHSRHSRLHIIGRRTPRQGIAEKSHANCVPHELVDFTRADLRRLANFDLEDSDDLAALLGKRYGL
jgi:hypothetical protein